MLSSLELLLPSVPRLLFFASEFQDLGYRQADLPQHLICPSRGHHSLRETGTGGGRKWGGGRGCADMPGFVMFCRVSLQDLAGHRKAIFPDSESGLTSQSPKPCAVMAWPGTRRVASRCLSLELLVQAAGAEAPSHEIDRTTTSIWRYNLEALRP